MQIEQPRPTVYRVTLHTYELATLVAAARYVLDGKEGELTEEALAQLAQVMQRYDEALQKLNQK